MDCRGSFCTCRRGCRISDAILDLQDEAIIAEIESLATQASNAVIKDTLARGVSVFYKERGVLVCEDADGRQFEVRHTQLKRGAYDMIRELERAR